ncbi:MAG: hypothetical protein K6E84_00270 [Lachnospiraceae bacterium]|nr:hypothetical protein [Lachnospiraceae bacterium]
MSRSSMRKTIHFLSAFFVLLSVFVAAPCVKTEAKAIRITASSDKDLAPEVVPGKTYIVKVGKPKGGVQWQFVKFVVPKTKNWKFTFSELKHSRKKKFTTLCYCLTPLGNGYGANMMATQGGATGLITLKTKKYNKKYKGQPQYKPLNKRTGRRVFQEYETVYIHAMPAYKKGYYTYKLKIQ